jgi:hypothetical protein
MNHGNPGSPYIKPPYYKIEFGRTYIRDTGEEVFQCACCCKTLPESAWPAHLDQCEPLSVDPEE